ncbi:hypothetical protein M3Y98_00275600 [Aphelenchoides besseyi]|nr:hypothetical protein M3Y98_00275600 [Aphelenchoides besseyi]
MHEKRRKKEICFFVIRIFSKWLILHFRCCLQTHIDLTTDGMIFSVVRTNPHAFLQCQNGTLHPMSCADHFEFNSVTQDCEAPIQKWPKKRSSGSRTGDLCAFNTDCQSGMYCFNGGCTCLSDYVAISGYCWPKVNPGDSGCVEDLQCEAIWTGSKCARGGLCECPEHTVPAKTRDGTVCVSSSVPPACPLPEPNNPELPNPATLLANPSTHPLGPESYMPVLCTSTSNEVRNSNHGDGSSWCIYPDGETDVYIADIYNCIPHPQVKHEFFPEYSDTIDGICCHSRAFVCIQPMEQGEEPSIPRWWFNSVTGTCSQFLWDPNQSENVSPNNFKTVEHCESYCRDTCRRGPTQYNQHNRALILDETPVTNCLHTSGGCGTEFHCTLIGSHQHCCPTIAHICSPLGGRSHDYLPVENFDKGMSIAGSRAVSRFYYDTEQGRCTNFLYEGGLGSYNNWLTKQDCENFCSKLVCEYGNPLRIGDDWQRCETANDCPSSHQCETAHKVCCPTAQSICTQPKRYGDCTSSVRRYWYNAATRQCEMFQYTGCQGNDNNFDQLLDCQQKCRNIALEPKCPQGRAHRDSNGNFYKCSTKVGGKMCPPNYQCMFDGSTHGCCPTRAYTCSLSPDKGVQCGAGRSFRYYFNAHKQTCESFQYEGCDGNSNLFQNVEDCQDYCGVGGCPNGGQPLRDLNTNQFAVCSETTSCPSTHECVTINFNGNVAYRCCPTKAHICTLPPQQGNLCTKMSITRFYFNIVTKECEKFSFNGCNGNLNRFETREQCTNFCSSSACTPGEITYKDINVKKVVECSPSIVNSCPLDFTCKHDSLTSKHVCCGTPPSDVCPEGEKAYVNPLDESVKECTINMAGSCPSNYLCRFSPVHNRYYCCASRSGNVCPDGRAIYRISKTLQPTRCTLSSAQNPCPDGFSCQSRVADVLQGYCCSSQNVCRGGADFLIDETTKMPKICMPGAFVSCPTGYRCYKSPGSTSGYCCKGDNNMAITEGCPPGEFAYTRKREIVNCDPFNMQDKGCPMHYSCQYALAFQRYQCCGKEPIDEDEEIYAESGCLHDQVAFIAEGTKTPQVCTASGPNTCPLGYFCQFSDKNKQFQCCAHKGGCPDNGVAYIGISGQPETCKFGLNDSCPHGYSCQQTRENRDICCTKNDNKTTETNAESKKNNTKEESSVDNKHEGEDDVNGGDTREANHEKLISRIATTAPRVHTICRPNEHLRNGICMPRKIGDSCVSNDQCPRTSVCLNHVCHCPEGTKQEHNVCIPDVDESTSSSISTDNSRSLGGNLEGVEEMESKARKCKADEIIYRGHCLKRAELGETCVTKEQCLNGAHCYRGKCRCPTNKAAYQGVCIENACGGNQFRLPQLDQDTSVIICADDREICTLPHRCTYSKVVSDYICCKSASVHRQIPTTLPSVFVPLMPIATTRRPRVIPSTRRRKRCPNDELPLMFVHTEQPVKCTPQRGCPKDYFCTKNICCPATPTTTLGYDEEE